jgi:hypothetical protein
MIRKLITLSILSGWAFAGYCADNTKQPNLIKNPDVDAYAAGQWTVAPFGNYRAVTLDGNLERFGAGVLIQYQIVKNIAIELNVESDGLQWHDVSFGDSFTDCGANVKGYLPLGNSGFAPYGFLGYSHGFEGIDSNRMNTGVGIELRGTQKLFNTVAPLAFADVQWSHGFARSEGLVSTTSESFIIRAGVGLHF